MRFRLRTLLIVLAVMLPAIGLAYVYRRPIVEFIVDDVLMRGLP